MRVLVTGATRGLGSAVARDLAARGFEVLVSGRDPSAVAGAAATIGAVPVVLDLADTAAVTAAASDLPALDGLVANAGVQFTGPPTFTASGVEETLAVNVLGHVALIEALLARDTTPGRVVLVGSGTHDGRRTTGMPAPVEGLDLDTLARGEGVPSGPRRYTTSKLHVTALAAAYARAVPTTGWSCCDPGLMPGTGLARDHGGVARALWSTALRAVTVLPFASTPRRSARALVDVLTAGEEPARQGTVFDHRGRPSAPSARAADPGYQDALLAGYRRLLASTLARQRG